MAIVYTHTRLDTNIVFYVGIGNTEKRAYIKSNRSAHWKRIINKHGYNVEIIENNLSWDNACEREKYWINFYGRLDLNEGNLINLTNGGDGTLGNIQSNESRLKISKALTGKKLSESHIKNLRDAKLGKKLSEKTKQKMSEAHSGEKHPMFGKTHSLEAREKIRQFQLNRPPVSLETRLKISKSLSGVNHPNFGKKFSDETKRKLSQSHKKIYQKTHKVENKLEEFFSF